MAANLLLELSKGEDFRANDSKAPSAVIHLDHRYHGHHERLSGLGRFC